MPTNSESRLWPQLIPLYATHRDWLRANPDTVFLALTLEPDDEVTYHLEAARAIAKTVARLHNYTERSSSQTRP